VAADGAQHPIQDYHALHGGLRQRLSGALARPGDVLLLGPKPDKPWGGHIALVEEVSGLEIRTIEANTGGTRGAVRRVHEIDEVACAVRWALADFDPELRYL